MRTHYPRTPHLPWSPGASADDVRATDLTSLTGLEVVVTEKLDGENTTLYSDGLHARSLDSAHHPSRTWVKALHGRIAHSIPHDWRICGENLFARHSVPYDDLLGYFYAFSVWADDDCLDWDETVAFAHHRGLPTPTVLWRGVFSERALRGLRLDLGRQEGYVVRTVAGFRRDEFGRHVAKWVRPAHVRTTRHWMHAPVTPNGLGVEAPLWVVRSGGSVEPERLRAVIDLDVENGQPDDTGAAVAEAGTRLDLLGRTGDARLIGVLAALTHRSPRAWLGPRLAPRVGMPVARRVADMVGRHALPHRPMADEQRRAALIRLSASADLGVLHAVAAAALVDRAGPEATEARDQVEWSTLHADEAGLLEPDPMRELRAELVASLSAAGLDVTGADADVADRCWAETRVAFAEGRVNSGAEAIALTWRWRRGLFPRLTLMVGPSGSGKSHYAGTVTADVVVSLDDLRAARRSRADQRDNAAVLTEGLRRLEAALATGGRVIWDATALTPQQRRLVHVAALRHDALLTHAVMMVPDDVVRRRNAARENEVPEAVLSTQLRRFCPPYPGEAHRTRYVDAHGTVADSDDHRTEP